MASTPKLTSCSTVAEGYLAVPVGAEVYMLVNKKHRGNPWRELEIFTQTELNNTGLGVVLFDLPVKQLILPDRTFSLITAYNPSGNIVRLYWNPGSSSEIRTLDLDVVNRTVTASSALAGIVGRDPFVFDGRTGLEPSRIYLTYVRALAQYLRVSDDDGATWGPERTVDDAAALIDENFEGFIRDPATDRIDLVFQQKRG